MTPVELRHYLEAACVGEKNASTISHICQWFDVPRRDVEAAKEVLQCAGVPICGSSAGLYIAGNYAEFERYRRSQMSRIQKISHNLKMMEMAFVHDGIQEEIFFG